MAIQSLSQVVDSGLCIGCGVCTYFDEIEMKYNKKLGQFMPDIKSERILNENALSVCPGKGYEINKLSDLINKSDNKTIELGFYNNLFAARSLDKKVLKNASSGGLITQLCIYLLENQIVDKIAVTKFVYTKNGPRTKSFLTSSKEELFNSQGSKYCPVEISEVLEEIRNFKGKVAFIGTPCQIAGIRKIQEKDNELKQRIYMCISNFCGGIKNYRNIEKIAASQKIDYKNIIYFRFRGNGQPGSLLIKDDRKMEVSIPYPKYVGYTGISKHLRCHLCVDATGELADVSFGDAWLEKYINDFNTWSFIVCRNKTIERVLSNMVSENIIDLHNVSPEEIIKSQEKNLISKKKRMKARMKLYDLLGYVLPEYDGGYLDIMTSLNTELKVFIKHKTKEYLEILNLYWIIYKLFKIK